MNVIDLVKELNLDVFAGKNELDRQITGGYVSDLLSDVIGNAEEGQVWITLQTHPNIIAVASLKDIPAILLVRGHVPDPVTIQHAEAENITLLGTSLPAFTVTGEIYRLLKG